MDLEDASDPTGRMVDPPKDGTTINRSLNDEDVDSVVMGRNTPTVGGYLIRQFSN